MINSKTKRDFIANSSFFVLAGMLLLLSIPSYSIDNGTGVKFKPEYKIKRIPNVGVTIYSPGTTDNKREEYIFKDFNADVVLLIYRHISLEQITSNLSKKYYLSKDDCRRGVKRVIYRLEEWGLLAERAL